MDQQHDSFILFDAANPSAGPNTARKVEAPSSDPSAPSTTNQAAPHLILFHGASQPIDSPFFNDLTQALTGQGINVHRAELPYMAQRRETGRRRPPPRIERLLPQARDIVAEIIDRLPASENETSQNRLIIGGKSMGGRLASLLATDPSTMQLADGAVAIGYPFHPPKTPDKLRTAHLQQVSKPMLIIQGERDPFGTRAEVASYDLDQRIEFVWLKDGDHDLKPRKASGLTWQTHITAAADAVAEFASR
ncbi:MAG: alpha/beta family hydrolase [Pseudomonadota bacterium]